MGDPRRKDPCISGGKTYMQSTALCHPCQATARKIIMRQLQTTYSHGSSALEAAKAAKAAEAQLLLLSLSAIHSKGAYHQASKQGGWLAAWVMGCNRCES